jgi:hypothetical protein
MVFILNKLAWIKSCEIILDCAKNHCEFQVHTILVCTLYSVKYGTFSVAPNILYDYSKNVLFHLPNRQAQLFIPQHSGITVASSSQGQGFKPTNCY